MDNSQANIRKRVGIWLSILSYWLHILIKDVETIGLILMLLLFLGGIMGVAPFIAYKGLDPRGFVAFCILASEAVGFATIVISVRKAKNTSINKESDNG